MIFALLSFLVNYKIANASSVNDIVDSSVSYQKISAGYKHSCALTTDGKLACWGSNTYGQIGTEDYSYIARSTPALIPSLEDESINDYATGGYNTCIINEQGGLFCWGDNNWQQLGNPDYPNWSYGVPVPVKGLSSDVFKVSIGNGFMCAIKTDGDIYCWGLDYAASYSSEDREWIINDQPVNVGHLDNPKDIYSSGGSTCALSTSGEAFCWGLNDRGQLGLEGVTYQPIPTQISLNNIKTMSLGDSHTCAITEDGNFLTKLWCWGENKNGELGRNPQDLLFSNAPLEVNQLNGEPVDIATGKGHTCAIIQNDGLNSVKCWGDNDEGQLGIGNTTDVYEPTDVVNPTDAVEITAGDAFTIILTNDGAIKSWGANTEGQLGNGYFFRRQLPINITNELGPLADVVSGENHTCALTELGRVYCWGGNLYGQLGNGNTHYSDLPESVIGLDSGVVAISAGPYHNCALLNDSKLKCWGYNIAGSLGTGDSINESLSTPSFVVNQEGGEPLSGVQKVDTGGWHTCALMLDGKIKCWGSSYFGQVGILPSENDIVKYPINVNFDGKFVDVTLGLDHTCAIDDKGDAYCWGVNYNGELGIGSSDFEKHPTPTKVMNISELKLIDAGGSRTCSLTSTGGVYCWGGGSNQHTPISIDGLENGVTSLSTGGSFTYLEHHTCALMEGTGAVKCFGYNNYSQLGDGTYNFFGEDIPVDVLGLAGNVTRISTGAKSSCALFLSGAAACWGADYKIETSPTNIIEVDEMFRPPSKFFSNYYNGSPQSNFVLTGLYFPPNKFVNILLNNEWIGSVKANETGVFKFFLYVDLEGDYIVEVNSTDNVNYNKLIDSHIFVNTSAIGEGRVMINIDDDYIKREKEGDGLTFGTSANKIFLPMIHR